jgi:exonuclease III
VEAAEEDSPAHHQHTTTTNTMTTTPQPPPPPPSRVPTHQGGRRRQKKARRTTSMTTTPTPTSTPTLGTHTTIPRMKTKETPPPPTREEQANNPDMTSTTQPNNMPVSNNVPGVNTKINTIKLNKIKIVSNNIRKGIEDKIECLNNPAFTQLADIIMLQEVNLWSTAAKWHEDAIDGYSGYFGLQTKPQITCKTSHLLLSEEEKKEHTNCLKPKPKNGVAIFIKNSLKQNFSIKQGNTDPEGRVLIVTLKNKNDHITLVNIYAPADTTKNRRVFYRDLSNIIKNHTKKKTTLIIGGDTNSIWRKKDTNSKKKGNQDYTIREFGETNDLTDIYIHKSNKYEHTWRQIQEGHSVAKRLDSFYTTHENLHRIDSCNITHTKHIPSDHKAVQITLSLN